MRWCACIPVQATATRSCTLPRRSPAIAGPPARPCSRPSEPTRAHPMDFTLSNEQRSWQMTARKFAEEEIRPISVERDEISDPRATFDWEIIKKGSRLGFRTMAVPKEWGGHGTDFVTQALVMAELAKGDSAISKTFSQCWKWSHLIAGSDNRLPPEDPKAGLKLKAERHGDEWILNGEKCFIANASVVKLFFIDAR